MGLMRAAKKNHRFVMAGILFKRRAARRSNVNIHKVYVPSAKEIYLKYAAGICNSTDFPTHPEFET